MTINNKLLQWLGIESFDKNFIIKQGLCKQSIDHKNISLQEIYQIKNTKEVIRLFSKLGLLFVIFSTLVVISPFLVLPFFIYFLYLYKKIEERFKNAYLEARNEELDRANARNSFNKIKSKLNSKKLKTNSLDSYLALGSGTKTTRSILHRNRYKLLKKNYTYEVENGKIESRQSK